jgi:glycosyltransferase involved in cell wall biosynthesis
MQPPVSCVLVTRDRSAFVPQALRCFASQDYPNKELIVVDDGEQPVEEACAGVPGVRYIRLRESTPTGTKLNLGIEAARGDILQKLDDDDFYAPGFLSAAVGRLRRTRRPDSLVVWCCFIVLIARERRLYFSGHGWETGATLCFRRSLWKRRPFRDMYASSDSWFIRDNQPRIARVCDAKKFLHVRHGRNTWRKIVGYETAESYFRLRPYRGRLLDIVGRDIGFYRDLMRASRAPRSAN